MNVKTGAAFGVDAEAALALVEEKGAAGTWSWDLEADRMIWSAGMYRLLGIEPFEEPPSVEFILDAIHPDDRLEVSSAVQFAAGDIEDRRFRIFRRDGEMRWIRNCARIARRRDGAPSRLIGVAFDITDLRRGLEAVQQETGLLTAIRELLGGVIWKTTADGSAADILEWHVAVGNRFGRLGGWRRLDNVHPDDRQMVRDAWATALRNRTRYAAEYRTLWQGHYLLVASRAVPVRDARGEITSWIGYSTPGPSIAKPSPTSVAPAPEAEIGAAQIRAARGFLGWTARELAARAGISFSTARRAEMAGERPIGKRAASAVRRAFEDSGIIFSALPDGTVGVALRPGAGEESRTRAFTVFAARKRHVGG